MISKSTYFLFCCLDYFLKERARRELDLFWLTDDHIYANSSWLSEILEFADDGGVGEF